MIPNDLQPSGAGTKDFHHPFEPYPIQQQFMQAVYDCIEDGKVGIFESPTGTGKSLSLICASLTWLREHKRKEFDEAVASVQFDDDEPDWMIQNARDAKVREIRQMRAEFEARLQAVRMQEQKVRESHANDGPLSRKRRKVDDGRREPGAADEAQFLLDDYESDNDASSRSNAEVVYSAETQQLMDRVGILPSSRKQDESVESPEELKVFFCSRTHSQLSQFVGELQRVSLPPGLPPEDTAAGPEHAEILKHITLGSRKNLCINPKVSRLPSVTAVNERCIELQQSTARSDQKCGFLPTKDTEDLVLDFRNYALAKLHDIEDLAAVGSKLKICPYYASRPAISPAEMVTLPYPLLLQKAAREALGISVKNHIVIIDEAHNLMSAIEGIHSTQVSDLQLARARDSLIIYLQKFRNRLKGKNRIYVAQVVRVIDSLLACIAALKTKTTTGGTLAAHDMLAGKAVDQVNLFKLVRYINDSKLARKVEGYIASVKESGQLDTNRSKAEGASDVPNLMHVQNFFLTLMNPSEEGRFFWAREGDTTTLRYLLLDPSEHFREIVEESRAVILAGGTMSPMEDYRLQLFPYVSCIKTLSCGHLIPPCNLLVRTIASDGAGSLEFTYKSRSDSSYSSRVGTAVYALASQTKGGLVVFFPSYGHLEQVLSDWRKLEIMERLKKAKPVFCDSRVTSTENTFKQYSEEITKKTNGAILLSVIGGKLSEGINFSDDLGRCVLVIGLPFPNLETPEWRARMAYIDEKAAARGEIKGVASREHAENVCMRSVNQAIGRVIRHRNDWASIMLMDSRYTQDRIRDKLPGWIRDCLPVKSSTELKTIEQEVKNFFSSKAL